MSKEPTRRIFVMPGDKDRRVPVENLKHAYFEHGEPRETYVTVYLMKRLRDGDLIQVDKDGKPVPVDQMVQPPEQPASTEPAAIPAPPKPAPPAQAAPTPTPAPAKPADTEMK